jgi:hypothetical protein
MSAILLALASLLGFGTQADVAPKSACLAGAIVVVQAGRPTRCDLDGSQTLVELGLTRLDCLDAGGLPLWWVCWDRDY